MVGDENVDFKFNSRKKSKFGFFIAITDWEI